jgi:hypothetical protein
MIIRETIICKLSASWWEIKICGLAGNSTISYLALPFLFDGEVSFSYMRDKRRKLSININMREGEMNKFRWFLLKENIER